MPLQIEILSKAEVEAIWKNRARAENFADYLNFINLRDIGDSFRLTVEKGEKNADSARSIRHNFAEAAKERIKMQRGPDGKMLLVDNKPQPVIVDGKPVLDPVILRWKVDSTEEKRKDKTGKETTVNVINKLTALLIASTDVKPRGPRVETEIVALNPTPEQMTAKAALLPDGRTAKLTKSGTWRAPKLVANTGPDALTADGAPMISAKQEGSGGVSTNGTTSEKAPAEANA